MSALSQNDLDYIRELIQRHSAIVLDQDKTYLIETRLDPLARQLGLASLQDLMTALRTNLSHDFQHRVVEAITTHETSFFRDAHPFETLKKVILPELIAKRPPGQRLTIWCAACSSGQEPYSVAMLVREHFPALAGSRLRIKMCIRDRDLFYRQQGDLRRVIADPAQLPHKAILMFGSEICELYFSAVHDRTGAYMGPMVTWDLVTEKLRNERTAKESVEREREQTHLLQTKVSQMLSAVSAAAAGDLTQNLSATGADTIDQMAQALNQLLTTLRDCLLYTSFPLATANATFRATDTTRDEINKEFLTESREGLDQLDNKYGMLEQNPEDRNTLASIFRTIHTVKGT